ncbi:hypothetical protein VIGAN_04407000, partial [Vigna angularis var. angularis]
QKKLKILTTTLNMNGHKRNEKVQEALFVVAKRVRFQPFLEGSNAVSPLEDLYISDAASSCIFLHGMREVQELDL